MDKPAVPKFSSFKPKLSARQSGQEEPERRESQRHGTLHEDRRGNRDHDRYIHHHRREQNERQTPKDARRHQRRNHQSSPESDPSVRLDEFEESNVFIVDRRGDLKNVEYGSLHRYNIPAYRRIGYGNVVGLVSSTKIDRNQSTEKEVYVTAAGSGEGHGEPKPLTSKRWKSQARRLRFVTSNSNGTPDGIGGDYIEVQPSRKRKRRFEPRAADVKSVDYRSIEGKAKASMEPSGDDLAYASESDSDAVDQDLDFQSQQVSATLSKQAKANPTNLDTWLALVDHQAKLVRPGTDLTLFTTSERRTLADLRLAILKEAASHISQGKIGREHLLLVMIQEGSIIWENAKLAARWKEALTECSSSMLLWTDYLDYIQDNYVSFHYDACKETYLQCLEILSKAYKHVSTGKKEEIGMVQSYVLERMTAFIRDAGYEELAIAIWQMLLEYSFLIPQNLREADAEDRLLAMEKFWESEAPRIGEQGSQGSGRWRDDGSRIRRAAECLAMPTADPTRPLASFASAEAELLVRFIMPVSTDDDNATADPLQYVMFSDFRNVIESLCEGPTANCLLDGFLRFIGLPPMLSDHGDGATPMFKDDPHLSGNPIQFSCRRKQDSPRLNEWKVQSRQECTVSLFDDAFEPFRLRIAAQPPDNDNQLANFISRLLDTLCTVNATDERLAEYYCAFKLHINPADAAKTAKHLLKKRPSSLRLYNAYALIQAKLERLEKAYEVWSTALWMTSSDHLQVQDDVVLVWHSRLFTQIRHGKEGDALESLLTITDSAFQTREVNDSQIRQLMVKKKLEEGFDSMYLAGKSTHAALYADLLAWLAYLPFPNDLQNTTETFEKYSKRFQSKAISSAAHELFQQSRAIFLRLHIKGRKPYQPALVRKELGDTLSYFPNNSIILDLHTTVTSQDRLRTLVQEQKSSGAPTSVVQWSFKLAEELRRAGAGDKFLGSTPHTVRASFANALLGSESKVRHSPALWMMWLRFEDEFAADKKTSLQRVRQVFLDGLMHLPWVKAWVIIGMDHLSDGGMSTDELRQVYEAMVERGLRVRIDIEDLI